LLVVAAFAMCAPISRSARAEGEAFRAMQRLAAADDFMRQGRLGKGYDAYLNLLKQFPTWWLPTVKAAVAARALGLPIATIRSYLSRVQRLSPTGPYFPLVRFLLDSEDPKKKAGPLAFQFGRAVWIDRANRLDLARGMGFERNGKYPEAEREYRKILARSPLCTTARFRLSNVLKKNGRGREAAQNLEEAATDSLFPARFRAAAGQDRSTSVKESQISY